MVWEEGCNYWEVRKSSQTFAILDESWKNCGCRNKIHEDITQILMIYKQKITYL